MLVEMLSGRLQRLIKPFFSLHSQFQDPQQHGCINCYFHNSQERNMSDLETHIQKAVRERICFLENLVQEKQAALANAPEGSLQCSSRGTVRTWYHLTEKKKSRGSYIPRAEASLAAALAQKDYDRRILINARRELASLRNFLRSAPAEVPEDLYETLSDARRELVRPILIPEEEVIRSWLGEHYEKKGVYRRRAGILYRKRRAGPLQIGNPDCGYPVSEKYPLLL